MIGTQDLLEMAEIPGYFAWALTFVAAVLLLIETKRWFTYLMLLTTVTGNAGQVLIAFPQWFMTASNTLSPPADISTSTVLVVSGGPILQQWYMPTMLGLSTLSGFGFTLGLLFYAINRVRNKHQ